MGQRMTSKRILAISAAAIIFIGIIVAQVLVDDDLDLRTLVGQNAEIKVNKPLDDSVAAATELWRWSQQNDTRNPPPGGLVIRGSTVLIADGPTLVALDLDSGADLWSHDLGPLMDEIEVLDDVAYVATRGELTDSHITPQTVSAINIDSGEVLWDFTGPDASINRIDEHRVDVIVFESELELLTLDRFSGQEISNRPFGISRSISNSLGEILTEATVGGSRYVYDFVGPARGAANKLTAIDIEDDRPIWDVAIEFEPWSQRLALSGPGRVVADDSRVYVVGYSGTRYIDVFDSSNGEHLWTLGEESVPDEIKPQTEDVIQFEFGEAIFWPADPHPFEDRLVTQYSAFNGQGGGLIALEASTGEVDWFTTPESMVSGALYNSRSGCYKHSDNRVHGVTENQFLTCIASNGFGWRTQIHTDLNSEGFGGTPEFVVNDELVVAPVGAPDRPVDFVALDAKTGTPVWSYRQNCCSSEDERIDVSGGGPTIHLAGNKVLIWDGTDLVAVSGTD